jgi:hypothetical protein
MNSTLPEFRAPTSVERAFNQVFGFLIGLGLGFSHNYLLQVRGRKSGKIYSTPIDLLELGGKRFLVAPRGRTQWVRNAEAAGEVTLKKGKTRLKFHLSLSRQFQARSAAVLSGGGGFAVGGFRAAGTTLSGVRVDCGLTESNQAFRAKIYALRLRYSTSG